MEALIGPAIVAAAIAALVSAIGWYVTHKQAEIMEKKRRDERIRDVQTALRAEIRSFYFRFEGLDLDTYADGITRKILSSDGNGESFTPFIPKEPASLIFLAITREVHILPQETIDPIVLFYIQMDTIASFADDLRSESFARMSQARKAEMYNDYVSLLRLARQRAYEALAAIDASGSISIPAGAQ